jgi:hypothetical protein
MPTKRRTQPVYFVQVVAFATKGKPQSTIRQFGPHTDRAADKIEDGLNEQLDHERYFTRRIEAPQPKRLSKRGQEKRSALRLARNQQ